MVIDLDVVADSAVRLSSEDGELVATFLPAAGMICSSLRHGGEELLGQRAGLEAYLERGSAFALPLLYPWANRLSGWDYSVDGVEVQLDRDEALIQRDPVTGVPIHGVMARTADWTVTERSDTALRAELDFGADPRRLAAFPFAHSLTYLAVVHDRGLDITLVVRPTGRRRVPVTFGFHPFLALPGADRRAWQLRLPVENGALDGALSERSFDDGFTDLTGPVPRFEVAAADRRLTVAFLHAYPVAQVFAPADSAFICFEPMTAPVDALRTGKGLGSVAPGDAFFATFSIGVERSGA